MNRRRRILLGAVLATMLAGAGVAVWRWSVREPTYQGRSLSEWLEDYGSVPPATNTGVDVAVRAMGTNAIPTLLRMLQARDSRLENRLVWLARHQSLIPIRSHDPFARKFQAVSAFAALGPQARTALPELVRLSRDRDHAQFANDALAGVGPEAIPMLLVNLTNQPRFVQSYAVGAVGQLGTNGAVFVPPLLACLKNPEWIVRAEAVDSLGFIGQEPGLVVPALVASLHDSVPWVCLHAIRALGRFGPQAANAAPAIQEVIAAPETRNDEFQQAAAEALRKIVPGGSKAELVPARE